MREVGHGGILPPGSTNVTRINNIRVTEVRGAAMRVFVTGATGVIGRRAISRLVAAGHQVTGVARTPEKAAQLRDAGATPVAVDLFDAAEVRAAVAGHDAVINLATKIPPLAQMPRLSAWAENERIRREASGVLVDAAIAAGATVFVQESLAFVYGEHGSETIDATTASLMDGFPSDAVAIAEANVERFREQGGRGVVLRFGRFYAPDSDQIRALVQTARAGMRADFGPESSYAPMIDVDDAAAAVVAALEAPSGVYDIVDSEPLTRAEQADALAHAVGRPKLHAVPMRLPKMASYLTSSQRVTNERFCSATGWEPRSPSVRDGFVKLVRQLGIERALNGWSRLMLWILTFSATGVGVQAAFFPRSFYDDFPFGRGWVAMDGPYNQHLVRDVGALNLSLLVVTVAALALSTRALARTAAIGWLVYSVPHYVYHLRHLTMSMAGADKIGIVVSLAITVAAPIVLLLVSRTGRDGVPSGSDEHRLARAEPASG
ncbi:MAG TPA: NAD-dependent epimerase/dehydratase family protein [Acidimicrobiia bacterium]|nr:NAD-dependent epimerase/dehydratase family protein [Acidimicrobiia bacterium]